MFTGFSEESTAFLWGIRFNNNREWFLANKDAYVEYIQKPLSELARDVWTYMMEKHKLDISWHVSRIYRDARRIRTGGPYKENLWFTLDKDHKNGPSKPAFFFEISSEGYIYGVGYYAAPPSTMAKFRDRLDANPAEFKRIAEQIKVQRGFRLCGDEYSRKKGEKGGILDVWYNRKNISVISKHTGHEELYSSKFTSKLCSELQKLIPLYNFLWSLEGDDNSFQ